MKAIYETAEINPCYELKNIFSDFKDRYKNIKIGIAKDSAFSFYYNDNMEFLENLGAEIKYFSPFTIKKFRIIFRCFIWAADIPKIMLVELAE